MTPFFFVEFNLSCQEKKLNDAQLQAIVSFSGNNAEKQKVISLPVAHGRQGGRYEVSWIQPSENVKSGDYVVDFYREVDRRRALESTRVTEDIEKNLDPLFSIKFTHLGGSGSRFPISMEVVALVGFGSAFFWMVFQKMDIEGTRKNKKKKQK